MTETAAVAVPPAPGRPEPDGAPVRTRQRRLGSLLRALVRRPLGAISLAFAVLVLLTAVVGPYLAPYGPEEAVGEVLAAPSGAHPMGTDGFGRDVWSRFLSGSRVSILIALSSVLIAAVVGSTLGMLAALWSGRFRGGLIMRAMDVILAFPLLVLVPVVSAIVGARLGGGSQSPLIALIIGLVFTPLFARVARASVLAELRETYVEAARSYGTAQRGLLVRHVLPNISAPLVVQAAFAIAIAVEVEAAVSFLGLGVQPPDASWGTILHDARRFLALGAWWLALFPCLGVAITALSFNVLGDVTRDELDPRSHQGRAEH